MLPDDVQAVATAGARASTDPRRRRLARPGPRRSSSCARRSSERPSPPSMAGLTERGRLASCSPAGSISSPGPSARARSTRWRSGSRSPRSGRGSGSLLIRQPVTLRRSLGSKEHVEGDDVTVGLEAHAQRHPGPRSLEVYEQIGKLGERKSAADEARPAAARALRPAGDAPRGRYRFEAVRAVFEDPFSLAAGRAAPRHRVGAPRLSAPRRARPAVHAAGGAMQTGGRVLLRRTAGYDLHSVREYEQGESLRKVHWRTTARRGTLMVKELEDMPHDEVAVLLDARRAARRRRVLRRRRCVRPGSILRAHALRGAPLSAHGDDVAAGVEPRRVVRRRVAGRAGAARGRGADRHRAGRPLPRP